MRSGNRSNALLVELLIVVMFFMLASTVLLQVFAAARNQSTRAELITRTLAEAQNIADRLYAADDPEELLNSLGFDQQSDLWLQQDETRQIEVQITDETDEYGTFRRQEVRVTSDGKTLFTLPCSRWMGGAE